MNYNVFILYGQHKYRDLKERIENHFCVMSNTKGIKVFHDDNITEVENIRMERMRLIREAHIVILIISPVLQNFLDQETELYNLLLDRFSNGDLLILPVSYRHTYDELWFYKTLEYLPSKLPIRAWKDIDSAWVSTQRLFINAISDYKVQCEKQKIRYEELRKALSSFNFYKQLEYLNLSTLNPEKSVFAVFIIEGAPNSGHNLLSYRLREHLYPKMGIYAHRISMKSNLATDQIWDRLSEFFPDEGNQSHSPDALLIRIEQALGAGPRTIVFEEVESRLHNEAIATFLQELNDKCQPIFSNKRPTNNCCIFVLIPKYDNSNESLRHKLPEQYSEIQINKLPVIEPVTYQELETWVDLQIKQTDIKSKLKYPSLIAPDSVSDNAVMSVLKRVTNRICETADLTEAIFKRYLETLS